MRQMTVRRGNGGRMLQARSLCLVFVFQCTVSLAREAPSATSWYGDRLVGAVVANIKVTLTNLGTRSRGRATTDSLGGYRFVLVPVGTYSLRLRVRARGRDCDRLVLGLSDERRQDFTMKVGRSLKWCRSLATPSGREF